MRTSTFAAACLCSAMLVLHAPERARAQGDEQADRRGARTERVPTIRLSVSEALSEAQRCIEEEDFECARERLDDVRNMRSLSGFETATLWTIYGSMYVSQESYVEAIRAFENVVGQEDATVPVIQTALYTLAQLYGQEERYEDALAMLEKWFLLSDGPSPDAYMLKARYHLQLEQCKRHVVMAELAVGAREQCSETKDMQRTSDLPVACNNQISSA